MDLAISELTMCLSSSKQLAQDVSSRISSEACVQIDKAQAAKSRDEGCSCSDVRSTRWPNLSLMSDRGYTLNRVIYAVQLTESTSDQISW